MPIYRTFTKTYEDICDERAKELLERATKLDVALYTFWSGGIDSTLALTSFLKNANGGPKRSHRCSGCRKNRYPENPNFYHDHIHRGKLRRDSAAPVPLISSVENI